MNDVPDFLAPDTLYPGKGQGIEGVANCPDGPPADFATRPAGRQGTDVTPIARTATRRQQPGQEARRARIGVRAPGRTAVP